MIRQITRLIVGVVAGVAILVAAVWILSLTLGSRDTQYEGQSLFHWQIACLSTNPAERSKAIEVLNARIIPDLTNTLFHDWQDSRSRMQVIEFLNRFPGVEIPYVDAWGRRGAAAAALGDFGPPASPAIPSLIQALNGSDDAVRKAAAIALGRIHSEPDLVIPMLIPYLNNPEISEAAVQGVGGFGPAAKPAVPELMAMINSPDHDVQKAVWYALQGIDPEAFARAALEFQASAEEDAKAARSAQEHTNSTPAINSAQ